jgi:ABC-2 type transport system ATP-binding protein
MKGLVAGGTTVLLTTQYLEEADHLADTICVIDHGRVIAEGTSDELKSQIGGHRIVIALVDAADTAHAREVLGRHGDGEVTVGDSGRDLDVPVRAGAAALQAVLADLSVASVALHDAGIRRPTLDDVFLTLTGHHAEEVEAS